MWGKTWGGIKNEVWGRTWDKMCNKYMGQNMGLKSESCMG